MKKLMTICLACLCILLTTAVSRGSVITIIDFNENGVGHINGNLLDWGVSTNPNEGLYYVISYITFAVEGDVVLYEDATKTVVSDLLRFRNTPGTADSRIYVLSEQPEAGERGELADIGIPDPQYFQNPLPLVEDGTENGWNGLHYTPTQNQPGYIGGSITYNFTSDIPEPTTICLLG
jgi:hypothetical protein